MAKKEPKELPDPEQPDLFPELDMDNKEDKRLANLLRDWDDAKEAHADGIANLHKDMVAAQEAAEEQMVKLNYEAIRYNGYDYKLKSGKRSLSRHKAKKPKKTEE